ncbi:MAG: hypothetical protein MZV64_05175 [Ignavibacteriales bacterium]|nr:hypothetical protein [Ignavibacteriales bacterium]
MASDSVQCDVIRIKAAAAVAHSPQPPRNPFPSASIVPFMVRAPATSMATIPPLAPSQGCGAQCA